MPTERATSQAATDHNDHEAMLIAMKAAPAPTTQGLGKPVERVPGQASDDATVLVSLALTTPRVHTCCAQNEREHYEQCDATERDPLEPVRARDEGQRHEEEHDQG